MASDPESNPLPTDSGRRRHQAHHHNQSSPADLFSSASLLAGSARSAFSHDGAALDKAKLSEAGENLIAAASEYGKLEERGYGSYIEKAETYLHQLHSSPEKKPTDHSPATEKATEGEEDSAPEEEKVPHGEKKAPEEHHSGGGFGGFGGGGFGDYMKVAEGFLKK